MWGEPRTWLFKMVFSPSSNALTLAFADPRRPDDRPPAPIVRPLGGPSSSSTSSVGVSSGDDRRNDGYETGSLASLGISIHYGNKLFFRASRRVYFGVYSWRTQNRERKRDTETESERDRERDREIDRQAGRQRTRTRTRKLYLTRIVV